MEHSSSSHKFKFASLILLISLVVLLIFLFLAFQLNRNTSYLERLSFVVRKAHRVSLIDPNIKLERAFGLLLDGEKVGVFKSDCSFIYSNDLALDVRSCMNKENIFVWKEVKISDELSYLVSFRDTSSFDQFVVEHYDVIRNTALLYFILLITFLLLVNFYFFSRPLKLINSWLDNYLSDPSNSFLKLSEVFSGTFFSPMLSRIDLILIRLYEFKNDSERRKMAKEVVHDMKAPIGILKDWLKKPSNDFNLVAQAVSRMDEITGDLLGKSTSKTNYSPVQIAQEVADLFSRKCKINVIDKIDSSKLFLPLDEIGFYRIILNCIKNSIEAKAVFIDLEVIIKERFLVISIIDNGEGITKEVAERVLSGFTTKAEGTGIGISSSYEKLRDVGGNFKIECQENGTLVSIAVPILDIAYPEEIILIDDDKYVGLSWKTQSEKLKIKFTHVSSPRHLYELLPAINLSAEIYIDFNFHSSLKGDMISALLYERGCRNLRFATGDNFIDVSQYDYILDVIDKRFPY